MRENTDYKNSECGHFSRSGFQSKEIRSVFRSQLNIYDEPFVCGNSNGEKSSIVDIRLGSECASGNEMHKKCSLLIEKCSSQ